MHYTFLLIYLIATIATFFCLKRLIDWGQPVWERVALALLWPAFWLMAVDWGFGSLVDRVEDRLFHRDR